MEHADTPRFSPQRLQLLKLKKPQIRLSLLEPVAKKWSRVMAVQMPEPPADLKLLSTFLCQIDEVYKVAYIDLSHLALNR